MFKKFNLTLIVAGALLCTQLPAFGQTPQTAGQRIPQPVIINGQAAQGALVVQNGSIQSYTCASPQQYATPDRASSGWACFDQVSGQWLLHALPPQVQDPNPAPVPAPAASQPPVVYGAPLPGYIPPAVVPAYGYYPYDYYSAYYPYGYYPYGYYPYFAGARFGFGFGYGYGFRGPIVGARPFGGGVSVVRAGGRVGGGRR